MLPTGTGRSPSQNPGLWFGAATQVPGMDRRRPSSGRWGITESPRGDLVPTITSRSGVEARAEPRHRRRRHRNQRREARDRRRAGDHPRPCRGCRTCSAAARRGGRRPCATRASTACCCPSSSAGWTRRSSTSSTSSSRWRRPMGARPGAPSSAPGATSSPATCPRDGARRVFADRDQGSATMLAPAGTLTDHGHGYRLSGRWPFTSNCLHSEWIGLGAFACRRSWCPPALRVVFLPAAEVSIEDTWESSGLRATGSHQVTVSDVAVDRDALLHLQRRTVGRWPAVADPDRHDLPAAARQRSARHCPRCARRSDMSGSRRSVGSPRSGR